LSLFKASSPAKPPELRWLTATQARGQPPFAVAATDSFPLHHDPREWQNDVYSDGDQAILCLMRVNGSVAHLIDEIELPNRDFAGELTMRHGSKAHVTVGFSKE
jgi:hypothetical protein